MVEIKYALHLTEEEIKTLISMIQNENVELVNRVIDGETRIQTINKLIKVMEENANGNNKTESKRS